MKNIFITFILLSLMGLASAQPMTFTHPGAKETIDELNFVKAKIADGAQPWTAKWNEVRNNWAIPGLGTIPALPDENGQRDQAKRAYANALAYWYTGTATYADQAISILKAWNNVAPYSTGDASNSKLDAAWIGSIIGPAAELLRGYMTTADRTLIINMFKTVFYPSLKAPSTWNGNVEATQVEAMFSISVFCEDKALFDYAITRFEIRLPATIYLKTDGSTAISLPGASWYSPNFASANADGLGQETCRDFGHHAQFAVSAFISAAEVAFHQGTDLYKTHQNRLVAGLELLAKQMTTGDLQGVCTNGTQTTADTYNTFEIGYNHYHNVVGLPMTETAKVLSKIQGGTSDWDIFYETLTHNGVGGAEIALCSKPNLGADQGICGKTSIILDAGLKTTTNKTLSWYKDNVLLENQTLPSLTVTQAGTYRIDVDSAGCKTSDNVVISGTLAVDLGVDKELCTSATQLLDVGSANGSAATFLWNTGATTQSISVSKAGTYTVTVSAAGCASVSDAVVVTSKLLTVSADTLCLPGVISLTASGGSAYNWYDVATEGTSLFDAATFRPTITATKTYYVQDPGGISASVSKTVVGAGTIWNANTAGDFSDVGKINKLIVLKSLTLNSIAVNVRAAGNVTLNLKQNGTTIHTKTVAVTGTGLQPINFNIVVEPGEYILDAVGTTATIGFEATGSGQAFPYTYPEHLTYTYNVAWSVANGWYGYLYDIKFTAGNICARTPVNAVIDNTIKKCVSAIAEHVSTDVISVYPNPAKQNVTVTFNITEKVNSIEIINSIGQVVYSRQVKTTNKSEQLDISYLQHGNYYIKVYTDKGSVIKKMIKQ